MWKGANGASGGFKSFVKAIEGVDSDPKVRELCDRYNGKWQRQGQTARAGRQTDVYTVLLAHGVFGCRPLLDSRR